MTRRVKPASKSTKAIVRTKVEFVAHKAVKKAGAVPYIPHLSHPRPPVNHAPGKNYLGALQASR